MIVLVQILPTDQVRVEITTDQARWHTIIQALRDSDRHSAKKLAEYLERELRSFPDWRK